jgi:hypothetical protein
VMEYLHIPTNPDGTFTCPVWFWRAWHATRYVLEFTLIQGPSWRLRPRPVVEQLLQAALKERGDGAP